MSSVTGHQSKLKLMSGFAPVLMVVGFWEHFHHILESCGSATWKRLFQLIAVDGMYFPHLNPVIHLPSSLTGITSMEASVRMPGAFSWAARSATHSVHHLMAQGFLVLESLTQTSKNGRH